MKKRSPTPAARSQLGKLVASKPTQDRPTVTSSSGPKPWMRHAGKLKHLHKETKRINQRIEEAFEQIDSEAWNGDSRPD